MWFIGWPEGFISMGLLIVHPRDFLVVHQRDSFGGIF